jgi:hypothetical protein
MVATNGMSDLNFYNVMGEKIQLPVTAQTDQAQIEIS